MALPRGFPFSPPPPPPSALRPPPPQPWRPSDDSSASPAVVIASVCFVAGAFFLAAVLSIMCSCCKGHPDSSAADAGEASAMALRPRTPAPEPGRHDVQQLPDAGRKGPPRRRGGSTAGLPSFTYSLSIKHNLTDGGEEAAACSVCLGAFQLGETVRLLPACLHLYHEECIDPWLHAHSTCPLCRSGTDTTMDGGQLPPV
ncbi:hypothetical protein ACP70R_043180 [Stipagrostis hirtigluma subsp. patula]